MLSAPTVEELAQFTGRPVASYSDFASQALLQSTLMLQTLTRMSAYPDDPDRAQLAKYAIVEMADRILLEQPYALVKSSPFQTETIGSYSYSKTTPTSKTASQGSRTGLFWWDIAIDELTELGQTVTAHGSIKVGIDGLEVLADGSISVIDPGDDADRPPYVRIS